MGPKWHIWPKGKSVLRNHSRNLMVIALGRFHCAKFLARPYQKWLIDLNRNFFRKSNTSTYCLTSLGKIWKSSEWILKKLKICKISPTLNAPPPPRPPPQPLFESAHRAPCRAKNTLAHNKSNTSTIPCKIFWKFLISKWFSWKTVSLNSFQVFPLPPVTMLSRA